MSESESLSTILSMLNEMRGELSDMRSEQKSMRGELGDVRSELSDVRSEQKSMRGELGDMRGELGDVRSQLTKVQMNQENTVMPRLDLLYEGHTSILEKMQNDTRMQALQDRVETLEYSVKYLSTHLKKAE